MRLLPIALLLLVSATPASSGASTAHGALRFDHKLFSIKLPPGWYAAEHQPPTFRRLPAEIVSKLRDADQVAFADGAGNYFMVFADVGTEPELDALWTLRALDSGRVAIVAEGPFCRPSAPPGPDEKCTWGNGRLEIVTTTVEFGPHGFWFLFGNDKREKGVSLQVFRGILSTFQAR